MLRVGGAVGWALRGAEPTGTESAQPGSLVS